MSNHMSPGSSAATIDGEPDRAKLIAQLTDEVTSQIADGMQYRGAVRSIATSTGLPLLTVRRLTRDHPAAPLP
jgi:hypothetical protein